MVTLTEITVPTGSPGGMALFGVDIRQHYPENLLVVTSVALAIPMFLFRRPHGA